MGNPQPITTLDSASEVLAALGDWHETIAHAEIQQLKLAVAWAVMHPVESIDQAATVPGTEGELAIAGPGAPLVAEFCVPELALVLGMSTDSGRNYLGDAVELRYRLPKTWAAVTAGRVVVWKARKVAQATRHLSQEAATYVDTHLAPVLGKCSFAQIERTVEDALVRFDPAEAERRRREAAESRHFDIHLDRANPAGTVYVDAEMDLADALDLNTALTAGAKQLADLGSTESLNVRRSMAAGALARGDQTLDLDASGSRDLTIYVHLGSDQVAGVENTRSSVTVEQVKDWCTQGNAKVSVRPVIDLNDNLATSRHQPTPTMREQAILTNPVCVFVHCTRPARRDDLDHIIEPEHGGTSDSWNLAPLCRGHHRVKTHSAWTYVRTGPTTFTWTSPHGRVYDWDTRHARHTR